MIRKLLAAGIVLAVGYVAGVFFGYRAAVADYVENDAENIESMAEDLYPSPSEGTQSLPQEVVEQMEEAERDESDEGATADGGSRGFQ